MNNRLQFAEMKDSGFSGRQNAPAVTDFREEIRNALKSHEFWLMGHPPEEGGNPLRLKGADLRQFEFLMANLRNASMSSCSLHRADIQHADLRGADFSDSVMAHADMTGAELTWANFNRVLMQQCQLMLAKGSYTDFSDTRMDEVNLTHAQISHGQFHRACLMRASLCHAEMPNSVFREASLRFADLRGANLKGSDLRGALLDHAVLAGVTGDGHRIKSIDVLGPSVVYTDTELCIGSPHSIDSFKSLPIQEWWGMSPSEVAALGVHEVTEAWWSQWRGVIQKIVEESPAQSLEESLQALSGAGFAPTMGIDLAAGNLATTHPESPFLEEMAQRDISEPFNESDLEAMNLNHEPDFSEEPDLSGFEDDPSLEGPS